MQAAAAALQPAEPAEAEAPQAAGPASHQCHRRHPRREMHHSQDPADYRPQLVDDPVSMSERELLLSLQQQGQELSMRKRMMRAARVRGFGRRWPRWGWPALYFCWQAAMFAAIVRANTVVGFSELLTTLVGQIATIETLGAVSLFAALLLADPGYIRTKREHARGDPGVRGVTVQDDFGSGWGAPGTRGQLLYCAVCCTSQPLRSRHCSICDRCIYTYDHHCWWLDRCIGGGNKRLFVLFLFAQCSIEATALYCLVRSLRLPWAPDYHFFHQFSVGALLLVTGIVAAWNLQLLLFHSLLAVRNETSFERLRPERCHYLPEGPPPPGPPPQRPQAAHSDESWPPPRAGADGGAGAAAWGGTGQPPGRRLRALCLQLRRCRCGPELLMPAGVATTATERRPRPFDRGIVRNCTAFCMSRPHHWPLPPDIARQPCQAPTAQPGAKRSGVDDPELGCETSP
eukprot:TRINITY_DN61709_c0_g1_i1.p1 TRINITY_DN61709_c0_g1~~TRINITY_DN61709_c0_g1_i1.p1  ORF type:complete len:458 (+),score=96.33 TRINITY_DN61709_c0_g1_i1:128-1501(+)